MTNPFFPDKDLHMMDTLEKQKLNLDKLIRDAFLLLQRAISIMHYYESYHLDIRRETAKTLTVQLYESLESIHKKLDLLLEQKKQDK